jgi:hypothetical protein
MIERNQTLRYVNQMEDTPPVSLYGTKEACSSGRAKRITVLRDFLLTSVYKSEVTESKGKNEP